MNQQHGSIAGSGAARCEDTAGDSARRYKEFVDSSPQGILYCHTWWLDAVAPGAYEILKVENAGRLLAAWPLVWMDPVKRDTIGMPPLTQKLGVLLRPPEGKYAEQLSRDQGLVGELWEKLPAGVALNQHFHETFIDWLPFYWRGLEQSTRYTYVLSDLSNLDAIWSGMRTTLRTEVRKARKAGIRVRETEDLELIHRVASATFARQGKKMPHGLDLLARIDRACVENAGRKILIAEGTDGQVHAGVYFVYDSRCGALILSGGDTRLRASGAGSLLHWSLLEFAGSVTNRFDFEGSMIQPIEFFYRGFGARQTPYFRIWGSKPPVRESRTRRLFHRVRSKLARMIAPPGWHG